MKKKLLSLTALVLLFTVLMSVSASACSLFQKKNENTGVVGLPNPFVQVKTMDEAQERIGYGMQVPEKVGNYKKDAIEVCGTEFLQVSYVDKDGDSFLIRKSKSNEDLTGDYNVYSQNKSVKVGKTTVKTHGNNGKVSNATWKNRGYSYAVTGAQKGLTQKDIETIVSSVK